MTTIITVTIEHDEDATREQLVKFVETCLDNGCEQVACDGRSYKTYQAIDSYYVE